MTTLLEAVLSRHGYSGREIPDEDIWVTVPCPYHGDKRSSARANGEQGAYRCMACGMKGDCIGLIRKQEETDFATAKRRLEEIAHGIGAELPRAAEKSARGSGRPRLFGEAGNQRGDSSGVRPRFRL